MRLALAETLRQDVAARLPEARVTRIYDGPRGYELIVEHEGRHAEIRSRADLKRIVPKRRGK